MKGSDRRFLRGLAHKLKPVVSIGRQGITDSIVAQVDIALSDHELIKVKLGADCPADRREAALSLSARTGSELVGIIGRVLILFRPLEEKGRIHLPRGDDGPGSAGQRSQKG